MLMPETVAEAVLPAWSVRCRCADWPAPSAVSVNGQPPVHVATPDSASVPVKVTVTSVLFQPLALAAGAGCAVMVGAVLSMLMPPTVAWRDVAGEVGHREGVGLVAPSAVNVKVPFAGEPASRPDRASLAV